MAIYSGMPSLSTWQTLSARAKKYQQKQKTGYVMQNRRKFIGQATLATAALLTSRTALAGLGGEEGVKKLTILHTNDVHSRLEPFPMDGGRNQGLGGVAARAGLIKQVRNEEQNVLLLDAGDIFQGTPFFNIYKGEPEMKAMAAMGYDAAWMGTCSRAWRVEPS